MKQIALVCTSIGSGEFLHEYCREIDRHGLRDSVKIIAIPDRKTGKEFYGNAEELFRDGFRIECPTMDWQDEFAARCGMKGLIPVDSDNRRNIGYLMAVERGVDVVISIDDDNYPIPGRNFFQEHADTIGSHPRDAYGVEMRSHWYNLCSDLRDESGFGFNGLYPRGFPYSYRHSQDESGSQHKLSHAQVAVNQGLWIGDPDVDAITWLAMPRKAHGVGSGLPFYLGQRTWLPINSQNTSLTREAVQAYYFIPMGNGMDRLGDIFQGYFLEACVKAMRLTIRVGAPVVDHRRNNHNYMADVVKEIPGIRMLEEMLPALQEAKLDGPTSIGHAYMSLADWLEEFVETQHTWDMGSKAYFHRVAFCMRKWVAACKSIG